MQAKSASTETCQHFFTSTEINHAVIRHSLQVLKGKLSHLAKYKSDRPLYSPLFFVIFHPHPMSKIRLPDGENI